MYSAEVCIPLELNLQTFESHKALLVYVQIVYVSILTVESSDCISPCYCHFCNFCQLATCAILFSDNLGFLSERSRKKLRGSVYLAPNPSLCNTARSFPFHLTKSGDRETNVFYIIILITTPKYFFPQFGHLPSLLVRTHIFLTTATSHRG